MKVFKSVASSLALISRHQRVKLGVIVAIQSALALLDLAAISLLGIVVALSASSVTGQSFGKVGEMFSRLGLQPTAETILWMALASGVLLISKTVLSAVFSRITFLFLARREAEISERMVSKLLASSLWKVQEKSSQATSYALSAGVNASMLGVLGSAAIIVSESVLVIVLFVGLCIVDLGVALYSLAFFVIIGVVLNKLLSGWASRMGEIRAHLSVESVAVIQDAIRAYREMFVLDRRGYYAHRYQEIRSQAANAEANFQLMAYLGKYVFEIALIVGGALLALTQMARGDINSSIAIIAVFFLAASRMMPSLLRIQGGALTIKSMASAAGSTYKLANELDSVIPILDVMKANVTDINAHDSRLPKFRPDIKIRDVFVTFPGSNSPVLHNLSLDIPEGTSCALIGSTGAGKSTLVDVILGIVNPQRGEVSIGGISPQDAIRKFRGRVSYVPQEVFLTSGSVKENVSLGLPNELVDEDLVWSVLEDVKLAALFRNERLGLATPVGEHGFQLSGGQRQRMGIARALYSQPQLLVMDEATSALDAETEYAIGQVLERLNRSVTRIVVAHRLATILNFDQVVYLENGRISASGTFAEVRSSSPQIERQARILGL